MALLVALWPSAAAAQAACPSAGAGYPPAACGLRISPSSGAPGSGFQVTGFGYRPNSTVTVSFTPAGGTARVLGTATTDGTGSFVLNLVVPSDAGVGQATVLAASADLQLQASFMVLAASTAPVDTGGGLPRTGSDFWPTVAAGVALVAVGSAALVSSRRRRQPST